MMDCGDLTNDRLVEPVSPPVRAHLDRCSGCRERQAELQSLGEELAALGRALPRDERPALVRSIVARIPRTAAAPASGWRWAAAFAAAAVLLFAIILATRETPTAPKPEIAVLPPAVPVEPTPMPSPLPAPVPPIREPGPTPVPPVRPSAPPPPSSPEPPPVVPLPKSPVVDVPAPAPPAVPRPVAPETKPARVALLLSNLEGAAELQDGAAWKKLARTADWEADETLRSGEKLARFTLPDGTRATLRPHSELRLVTAEPPSLALEKGEGFFEVVPGAGRRFSVATPDARIEVTGTQFSVKRGDRTEILVSSGEVKVTNDKGEVSVPAGTGSTARRGSAPTKPRVVDADRANAWRREMDGPETTRFHFDFEDGRLAPLWTGGRIVAGPARGFNRSCLEGSPGVDADLAKLDKRLTTVHGTLKFRFRYWTASADMIWVQLFSERAKDNFRFDLKSIGKEKWEAVEIPIADFYRLADGSHPQEGDRFTWMNFAVSGATGPVYFDDIELVEVQK
jgi:hypothetical protein